MKLWGFGSQASFQLECKDRQACLKFSTQLGSPADLHFVPPFPSHGFHERPQYPRHKGPAQRERDRARAAAHRAKLASQANASGDPAAAAVASATGTTPTPPVPSAEPSDSRPVAAALVAPTEVVDDEVCPDTEYASANDDDIGCDGRTAFRCFQSRMLYLPKDHKDGNYIVNYELCRRDIGVFKCESCAKVVVGLARIRCHRQVCQDPA